MGTLLLLLLLLLLVVMCALAISARHVASTSRMPSHKLNVAVVGGAKTWQRRKQRKLTLTYLAHTHTPS
jgi:hypothetical protein